MNRQYPIRKQRKAENRKRFIFAAQELFKRQGYQATTMEGIANHAGLHVQTLYRHFENKVQLAAAGDEEQLTHFRGAIRDERREGTTLQFWRHYVERAATFATAEDGGRSYRDLLHHYVESPAISSQLMRIGQEYQDLLAESLERDVDLDDPTERSETALLIALTLWGANNTVQRRHKREEGYDLVTESVAMIDRIERLYERVLKVVND